MGGKHFFKRFRRIYLVVYMKIIVAKHIYFKSLSLPSTYIESRIYTNTRFDMHVNMIMLLFLITTAKKLSLFFVMADMFSSMSCASFVEVGSLSYIDLRLL